MAKNIEIKARASNPTRQFMLAEQISDRPTEIIHQEDVFFNVSDGRLKLRVLSEDWGILIFYRRSDQKGPKTSEYFLSETQNPRSLITVLERAYGIRNQVIKTRTLHMAGRTRIHSDKVESLGDFLELEVVLNDHESEADGEVEARLLMQQLEISQEDLIECAYVDLLEAQGG